MSTDTQEQHTAQSINHIMSKHGSLLIHTWLQWHKRLAHHIDKNMSLANSIHARYTSTSVHLWISNSVWMRTQQLHSNLQFNRSYTYFSFNVYDVLNHYFLCRLITAVHSYKHTLVKLGYVCTWILDIHHFFAACKGMTCLI